MVGKSGIKKILRFFNCPFEATAIFGKSDWQKKMIKNEIAFQTDSDNNGLKLI